MKFMRYKLSNFGPLVKNYEKARRSYPREVFDYLKNNLPKQPLILDLGCGTGISTRQLSNLGKVIGCDPDPVMLKVARKSKPKNVNYVLGSANRIPFKAGTFDAVSAFASFHWFDNKKSIAEIKRVLKTGGKIFVVNKIGLASWGKGYRQAIVKAIGREVAQFRGGDSYAPGKFLKDSGFKKVRVQSWKKSELYTVKESLEYVQSLSIWNSVPKILRPKALVGLQNYFEKLKKAKGKIERKLTAKVVSGVK